MPQYIQTFKNIFKKDYTIIATTWFSSFSLKTNTEEIDAFKKANNLHIENDWERMKMIFKKNDYGEIHPELNNAILMAQYGAITGGILGGIKYYITYRDSFIEQSDAKIFLNKIEAYRTLSKQGLSSMCVGICKAAPILALFMGGFSLFCSCFKIYRNKVGIIEYTLGGFTIGALFKTFYGFKGMLIGGIVGGFLGTIFGIFYCGILKLFGITDIELQYAQHTISYNANIDKVSYKLLQNNDKEPKENNAKN